MNVLKERMVREADPYTLVCILDIWYVTSYCHLRHDIRNFRLSRISELELLPQKFERPAHIPMHQRNDPGRRLTVRALFDEVSADRVQESRFYYIEATEKTDDGLLVTLTARQEGDVLSWLMSWGRHVRVLEPASLQMRIVEEARAMLAPYTLHADF